MKIISFTVKNFRSITDAYKLPLKDLAVLVGPNNEGKSNVLRAIVISLRLLSRRLIDKASRTFRYRYSESSDLSYNWERDFPLSLRDSNPEGRSEFTLEFELTESELADFRHRTHVNLNTNLKLKLSIGRDDLKFEVVLPGRAKKKFAGLQFEVGRFVADRLEIQYVPAIRTKEMTESVVEDFNPNLCQTTKSNGLIVLETCFKIKANSGTNRLR